MSTSEIETKTRFIDRLSDFLQRNRVIFLIIFIALMAGVVSYFVWTEWQQRVREKSTLLSEKAQELYQKWQDEPEAEKKQSVEKELDELLQRALQRYPRQYAAQRAYWISADIAFEKKDWEKAAASYTSLAKVFPKSYLAPLSLLYAGVCFEELGNNKKALELYAQVRQRFKDSYLMPHVLFSIGRLREMEVDFAGALKAYNQLEDEHPLSNWTKAGRNRIIDLKIKGKISE